MALGSDHGCSHPLPAHTELLTVARGHLACGRKVSKLLLRPSTGRRHQLRLHCLALGHGVVGDVAYTGDASAERMMLHAWRLRLPLATRRRRVKAGGERARVLRRRAKM